MILGSGAIGTPQCRLQPWLAGLIICVGGVAGCQTGLRGEPWTIECLRLSDAEHQASAEAIADVLRQTAGINGKGVSVRHETDSSTIYYGTYYRKIDRMRGTREIPAALQKDLGVIKELYDDRGRRIFLGARMVARPVPDVGPPEWNLENVQGVYSLQVAVFFATLKVPNYKKAAVDQAAALRKKSYQAYYHHGQSKSVVTVGVFGSDAVVVDNEGRLGYSAEVHALQRKENFRYNMTNGAVWTASLDGQRAPVRSLLVRIPKPEEQIP